MYRYPEKKIDHAQDSTVHGYHPDTHTSNGALRGTKADIWEGGHRVPFFVRWPKNVKANSRCEKSICHTDILATVAKIAGAKFDATSSEDSFSFASSLQGKPSAEKRPPIIHQSGSGFLAIRDGDWKLVLANGSGGRQKPKGKSFAKPYHLFNLANDPGETKNLIEQQSQKANEMIAKFDAISHGDHKTSASPNQRSRQ
jgi:arylsulfatase A-like enzyme